MTTTVQFLFDFGSPNAYLVHKVIPGIEARGAVRFEYQPILLGGLFKLANNRSPMQAFGDIPNKLAYERLEMQRFIRRHGLTAFRFNPHFPVNTLKIMRGAVAAQELGCFRPYVDAVYAAMWERGLDMADDTQIASVLTAAGLDAAALIALAERQDVKDALKANTEEAIRRGAFGAPTMFVGDTMFFGQDRLDFVREALERR